MVRNKRLRIRGIRPGQLGGRPVTQKSRRAPGRGTVDPDTYGPHDGEDEAASDWWAISVGVEDAGPDRDIDATQADPPASFSHFELTLLRPDPLILARAMSGRNLRKRDWWEFEFEGDPIHVRRLRAIVMLTISTFARDETDERRRELRRWIALHYAARTASVLTRCAGQDQPERAPLRRLDHLDRPQTAAALARDLHLIRDRALVLDTLDAYARFLAALNNLPEGSLTRSAIDRVLGFDQARKRDAEDDAKYGAMPDLTSEERAEMNRLKDLAIRQELDPEGQARLLPLLKRSTAHTKARLFRAPAKSSNL